MTSSSQNPASFWGGKVRNISAGTLTGDLGASSSTQTRALGWDPGVLRAMEVAGNLPPKQLEPSGSAVVVRKGEVYLGNPSKPHPGAPPWLALLQETRVQHLASEWGERFLSGNSKLCFMYGQSVFSLSVGRSKALKHQTKARVVNWEYKNCG